MLKLIFPFKKQSKLLFPFIFSLYDQIMIQTGEIIQGVLRLIWSGRLECVFVDSKGAKISKNGNIITCRLSKNKHFLFYTQGRGGNIMPATPS